jgi:hypothetical protein
LHHGKDHCKPVVHKSKPHEHTATVSTKSLKTSAPSDSKKSNSYVAQLARSQSSRSNSIRA